LPPFWLLRWAAGRCTAMVRDSFSGICAILLTVAAPRKVLKPTEFQEFELKEKTVLSHNTAMYVNKESMNPLADSYLATASNFLVLPMSSASLSASTFPWPPPLPASPRKLSARTRPYPRMKTRAMSICSLSRTRPATSPSTSHHSWLARQ